MSTSTKDVPEILARVAELESYIRPRRTDPLQYAHQSVHAIVTSATSNRLILVLGREGAKFCGRYHLPGGRVEEGETLVSALLRELSEEIEVSIADIESMYYVDTRSTNYEGEVWEENLFYVLLRDSAHARLVHYRAKHAVFALSRDERYEVRPTKLLGLQRLCGQKNLTRVANWAAAVLAPWPTSGGLLSGSSSVVIECDNFIHQLKPYHVHLCKCHGMCGYSREDAVMCPSYIPQGTGDSNG